MKVAILGAMPEEIEPLLSALRERGVSVEAVDHANNKFYAAKLNGHDLSDRDIFEDRQGKVPP